MNFRLYTYKSIYVLLHFTCFGYLIGMESVTIKQPKALKKLALHAAIIAIEQEALKTCYEANRCSMKEKNAQNYVTTSLQRIPEELKQSLLTHRWAEAKCKDLPISLPVDRELAFAFNHSGILAYYNAPSSTFHLVTIPSSKEIAQFTTSIPRIHPKSISLNSQGSLLATNELALNIWHISNNDSLKQDVCYPSEYRKALGFTHNNHMISLNTLTQKICVHGDLTDKDSLKIFKQRFDNEHIIQGLVSDSGKLCALITRSALFIYNLETNSTQQIPLNSSHKKISVMRFSPDESLFGYAHCPIPCLDASDPHDTLEMCSIEKSMLPLGTFSSKTNTCFNTFAIRPDNKIVAIVTSILTHSIKNIELYTIATHMKRGTLKIDANVPLISFLDKNTIFALTCHEADNRAIVLRPPSFEELLREKVEKTINHLSES